MMSTQFSRFIYLSSARVVMGASKSNLAKLRKKTGFPFGNCKKALEENNNDLEKAEKWLEEQAKALGWSKAMKMENRQTTQGLVGIALDKQYAAMVEVNCETDFVSKNEKFMKLVDVVAKTCLDHSKSDYPPPKGISKVFLEGNEVEKLKAADQQNLSDHVVKTVALIGERLVVRRAALISAHSAVHLSVLTHPASTSNYSTLLGKYGAVLLYLAPPTDVEETAKVAKQLCQHVIGMSPATIEPSPEDLKRVKKPVAAVKHKQEADESDDEGLVVDAGDQDEETAMLKQAFLPDPDRKVADVVIEAGIKIEDFVRFECGEEQSDLEQDTKAKVVQAGG